MIRPVVETKARSNRDAPGLRLCTLLYAPERPTPTLPGMHSAMVAGLQQGEQDAHGWAFRDSPLHPANDRPIWHGSGTSSRGRPDFSRARPYAADMHWNWDVANFFLQAAASPVASLPASRHPVNCGDGPPVRCCR
jgi:hypothetical protein